MSMEQGRSFRISLPKFPTEDPDHRILRAQRSRYGHYDFYIYGQRLGAFRLRDILTRFQPSESKGLALGLLSLLCLRRRQC
jgi:hypothetical protein